MSEITTATPRLTTQIQPPSNFQPSQVRPTQTIAVAMAAMRRDECDAVGVTPRQRVARDEPDAERDQCDEQQFHG